MNLPPSNSDSQWEKLLSQAKGDLAPPVNLPALLRSVRQAPAARRESWGEEFSALFVSGRIVGACFAAAAALTLVATWQAWDSWQALPWAELLDATIGGAS